MPNYYVYNEAGQPLDSLTVNTYGNPAISAPPETDAAQSGALFTASASSSGTVALGLLSVNGSLRIANPAASGKTAYISRLLCGIGGSSLLSSLNGSVTITRSGTLSSPTTASPVNLYLGNATASAMTAQTSASVVSGGSQLLSFQLAPGTMVLDYVGGIVLPPGQSLCVNTVASSSSIGLTITSTAAVTWWEA